MRYRKNIGDHGEEFAARIILDQGFTVVERNYRCRVGEIDLIALKNNCYHFIEVKTRTTDEYGVPAHAVTSEKQRRIRRAAEYYMLSHGIKEHFIQFDVVEVYMNISWGCF